MTRSDFIGIAVCGALSVVTFALVIVAFVTFGDRP